MTTDDDIAKELTAAHKDYLKGRAKLASLSERRRAVVVNARVAGWSVYRIARHLGVHDNVVSAILKAAEKQNEEQP